MHRMVRPGELIASAGDGKFYIVAIIRFASQLCNARRWNDHYLGSIEYAATFDVRE